MMLLPAWVFIVVLVVVVAIVVAVWLRMEHLSKVNRPSTPSALPDQAPTTQIPRPKLNGEPSLPVIPSNPPKPLRLRRQNATEPYACHVCGRVFNVGEWVIWWPQPDPPGSVKTLCINDVPDEFRQRLERRG